MKVVGVLLLILSLVFFGMAWYKYSVYTNYEFSKSYNKNAYVGGDAYNYIINSNYFTGFSVLGSCAFLSGIILIGLSGILQKLK